MQRTWSLASLIAAMILLTACPGETPSEPGGHDGGSTPVGEGRDAGDGIDAGNGADAGNDADAGDGHPPTLTILAGTTPVSPANDNAPRVFGTAEPGSIVRFFASASCSGTPVAQATTDAAGAFSVTVSVGDDTTTSFHAIATDSRGRASACSAGLIYLEDSTPPVPPLLTPQPASPANDNAPRLSGTTEPGARLRLYTAAGCSGVPTAQTTADPAGAFSLTVSVADDSTTAFHATATDAAGNTSSCSIASPYREDSTPPLPPVLTTTTPASPANDNAPRLSGTAEAGATLRVFTREDCSGVPVAQTTASATNTFSLTVNVTDNSTTSLHATATDAAGNTSSCATGPTYREDSTAPAVPVLSTFPASPANNNAPQLSGTTEAGATVRIFTQPSCAGAPALQLTANAQGAFSGTVTVGNDTTTTFHVIVTDPAGNASACTAGATYREDSTPPPMPVLSSQPAGPANDNAPRLSASSEAGARVRIFKGSGCFGTSIAEGDANATGVFSTSASVQDNSATFFHATATDAAGNTSGCSSRLTYVEDSLPPSPSIFSASPASPANNNAPRLTATISSPGTFRVFLDPSCTGTPFYTAPVSALSSYSFTLPVADDTTTQVYEIATDAAGNSSACTKVFTYTEDSTPPAAPTFTGTVPASPANHNSPTVSGTAEPGARVQLFTGTDCTGTPAIQATVDASGAFSAILTVADNTTTRLRATLTDAAGNASPCVDTALSYVEDSLAPSATSALVRDGDAEDIDVNMLLSQVSANWSGFTDAQGIARYDFSLSTSASCPGTVVPTTDVGVGPAAVFTGLSLTDRLYYSCVRAVDRAGNLSAWKASDGFQQDSAPPAVTSTIPALNATGVDIWSVVAVNFSEPVRKVNASSFQVTANGSPATGTVTCAPTPTRCTFTPTQPFPHGTRVTATLTTTIEDTVGRPLPANHSWGFSTREPLWRIPQQLAFDSDHARVGIDDTGVAHAVWKTSSNYEMKHYVPGSGWQDPQPIFASSFAQSSNPPALAVAPSGAFLGAMNMRETGQFTKMFGLKGSGTAQPTTQLIGGQFAGAYLPRVAIAPNGNGFAVWYEYDIDGNYLIVMRYMPGTGWVSDHLLRHSLQEFADYTVAMDANGNALVVWSEASTSAGPWTLFYSTWSPSSGWSAPSPGPAITGNSRDLDLVFSQNGTGMLVWEGNNNASFASSYVPGTGFGPAVRLNSASTQGRKARVALDANGNAIALWQQVTSGTVNELWTNRYVQGTGWGTAELLSSEVRVAAIAVEPNGNAHAVFSVLDATAERFHARRYLTSSGWGSAQVIDADQSGEPRDVRVSVNPNGRVAAIWSRYRSRTSSSIDVWANLFN